MVTKKDIGKAVYRVGEPAIWDTSGILTGFSSTGNPQVEVLGISQYYGKRMFGEWFVKKEKTKMEKFYILWNPDGTMPPTTKFTSLSQARVVAEKMMERIGDGTMYVMESVSGYSSQVPKFVWNEITKRKK